MKKLRVFAKYILGVVGIYLLTSALIFIGFNLNYSEITLKGELPKQISVEKAEATKSDGRVYGYVANYRDNNINGKYIKVSVYDSSDELLTTEYLRIDGVEYDTQKLFKARFVVDGASSYSISIVEDENT